MLNFSMPSREIRTCFVTGGTGFVGSHLVEHLLRDGCAVRCLVRDPARLKWLEGKSVALVEGDLDSRDVLRTEVSGVDAVFHVAGLTAARTPEEYFEVNTNGSRNVAVAAMEADTPPGLFLFISSLAAIGPARADETVEETWAPEPVTYYGKSKLEAERVLSSMEGLPLVIVRPPAVYGPRDRELYPLFRLAARGILPVFNSSARISLIHVLDLAKGILAAARAGQVGEAYFLAHPEVVAAEQFPHVFESAMGRRVKGLKVPGKLLTAASVISETWGKLKGDTPVFNRDKVKELTAPGWVCSTVKSERDLGFKARIGIAEGFGETAQWYRKQGWL
jgi:nucleoside-diphosphate-sugar epimerase